MNSSLWNIDPAHSTVAFAVRHMVVSKVRGKFTGYAAELTLDPENLTGSKVKVVLDAASIDTGVADRDAHLKSADFFDAATHSKLTFESRRVERIDAERYRVIGDLTIKGTTREVVLRVEQHGQAKDPWGNTRAAFTAKTSIDRKDFGLAWNQVLETGGVMVGDRVDIEAEIEAVRQVEAQAA